MNFTFAQRGRNETWDIIKGYVWTPKSDVIIYEPSFED